MRKLTGMLLSLFLIVPSAVMALGMGEIQLNSSLNQPFDAEIELLSVTSSEAGSLKATLASHETFTRLGIDRPAVLMFLKFSVEQRDSRYFIKLKSTEPIREPYLSMLVELSWSAGRLLREYTVLIDPPAMKGDSPVLPAPAVASAAAGASSDQSAGATTDFSTFTDGINYGPVQKNDTLWVIAKRMRPDSSISIHQMMMALLKANPDAFYDNNINRLKAGYILRIDDPAMLTAMSRADALRAVSEQNRAWQDQVGKAAEQAGSTVATAGGGETGRAFAAPGEPRLKLLAPDGESKTPEGGAGNGKEAGVAHEELALAEELAEARTRENEQLKSRLKELEEQLASMQRLLELKDTDMAALQQQLGKLDEATGELQGDAVPEGDEEAVEDGDALGESAGDDEITGQDEVEAADEEADNDALLDDAAEGLVAESDTAGDALEDAGEEVATDEGSTATVVDEDIIETTEPDTDMPASEPAKETVTKRIAPPPPAPVSQPGFLDEILADPMMLGGLGAVVIALLALGGLAIKRRRNAASGFSESILTAGGSSILHAKTASGAEQSEESSLFSDLAVSGMSTLKGGETEADPLTEADVYMAYGRYTQAEELLKGILETQPERTDIKIKLLEVYYATKDRSAFETLAEDIHQDVQGSGPQWAKVLVMGNELCPDSALFSIDMPDDMGMEEFSPAQDEGIFDVGLDLDALAEDMEASAENAGEGIMLDFSGQNVIPEESGNLELISKNTLLGDIADPGLDLDTLLDEGALSAESTAPRTEASLPEADVDPLVDVNLGDLDFNAPDEAETAADTSALDDTFSLDLDDVSLDLDTGSTSQTDTELPIGEMDFGDLGDLDLGDVDAVGTKLDLARAYVDMGEAESARNILNEVLEEGSEQQKNEAQELLDKLS